MAFTGVSGNLDLGALFGGSSQPYLNLSKDFGSLFNQAAGLGDNAKPAIDVYRQLGNQLGTLFENYGAGQRQAINQRFDTQRNNVMGSLAKRGFSGSSLAPAVSSATERDRSLSLGAFEDSLLGQRINASQGVAQGLAGAHMGAADISQRLREALLGLRSSTGGTGSASGGGGGSTGGGGNPFTDPRDDGFFDRALDNIRGSFGNVQGGGGGGGGGGGMPAPSQPGFIDNPYGKPKGGGLPEWSDPKKAKEMGGFSSTGPPGEVGETYTVGGLTCTITANKGNHTERTCVPTGAIDEAQKPVAGGPENATGGIPGDLGDYGSMA